MFSCEDLFLDRARKVMKYLGVWLPPLQESAISKAYRIFMVVLQYVFLIFQLIYIGQMWGDFEEISQACYVLFTQANLSFKVTVFLVNDDLLRSLLEQMNSDIFQPQSPEHERILKKQAVRIKRFLFAFMVSAQTTCGLWALKPLFDDAGRNFPFKMWMPVTTESSPQYEFGFAFQLVTICMSASMYFGVDSVTMSTLIFGCAQMQIVQDKIMNVESIDYAKTKPEDRKEIIARNHKILVECVNHHQAIVTFTQMVEDAYHSYLLFQLTGTVVICCLSALRLLVASWQSMQFFSMICYLFVMGCQLFVCCWCGNELTTTLQSTFGGQQRGKHNKLMNIARQSLANRGEYGNILTGKNFLVRDPCPVVTTSGCNDDDDDSEELHTVMYKCAWYEQDLRFKKDLCFAMMRMSRPIVPRAGHYVSLSWQTFIAVLRMSYSYFAVLKQARK